jgi:phage gp46-like protein
MNDPVKIENWSDIRELVRMSIGTDKGTWWADPGFGSELWLLKKSGKTDGQTAGTFRRMLEDCLHWLVDDGLAEKVICEAGRTGKNTIAYCVTVIGPERGSLAVKEVWSAL